MPSPGILERNPEGTASGGNGADRRTARLKVILMPQHQMRTALGLDDDVLTAARVLATAHQPGGRDQRAGAPGPGGTSTRLQLGKSEVRPSQQPAPAALEGGGGTGGSAVRKQPARRPGMKVALLDVNG
jgi:hypothetical protein